MYLLWLYTGKLYLFASIQVHEEQLATPSIHLLLPHSPVKTSVYKVTHLLQMKNLIQMLLKSVANVPLNGIWVKSLMCASSSIRGQKRQ